MSSFSTRSADPSRATPTVGGYRRASRVRTTVAGTWFPATGPDDQPSGLLLLHPAVKPGVLTATVSRLAALELPGVLPMLPELIEQAGRNWLVATVPIAPTVADLLDDGPHRTPANAAALLTEVAETLADVHASGVAHGAVGAHAVVLSPVGSALLADWGTDEHADPDRDRTAWAEFAELLADHWCAGSPEDAAVIAGAARAAELPGPDGGLDGALEWLDELARGAERHLLVAAAARPVAPPRRRRSSDLARQAALVEQDIDRWEPASPAGSEPTVREPPVRDAPPEPPAEPAAQPPQDPATQPPAGPAAQPPAPRGRLAGARPVLLALGLALALVAAVMVLIRPFEPDRKPLPAAALGPLEIRAVTVTAEQRSSICLAATTITTNGQPGRVLYRWVGENGSQAVSSVTAGAYNYQLEIGIVWAPSAPPLHGDSITLQVIEPGSRSTSARIPLGCI